MRQHINYSCCTFARYSATALLWPPLCTSLKPCFDSLYNVTRFLLFFPQLSPSLLLSLSLFYSWLHLWNLSSFTLNFSSQFPFTAIVKWLNFLIVSEWCMGRQSSPHCRELPVNPWNLWIFWLNSAAKYKARILFVNSAAKYNVRMLLVNSAAEYKERILLVNSVYIAKLRILLLNPVDESFWQMQLENPTDASCCWLLQMNLSLLENL